MKTNGGYEVNLKKISSDETAYRAIIRMIFEHEFSPGDSLQESYLAEKIGVSRTPIRIALEKLVAEGLLDRKPNKGCWIPIPTPNDLLQVYTARKIIEGSIVTGAVKYRKKEDIDFLKDILEEEKRAIAAHDREQTYLCNEKFHFGIAKACRNIYLEKCLQIVFWRFYSYFFFFSEFYIEEEKPYTSAHTTEHHLKILEAIAEKNPDTASGTMEEHLDEALAVIRSFGIS